MLVVRRESTILLLLTRYYDSIRNSNTVKCDRTRSKLLCGSAVTHCGQLTTTCSAGHAGETGQVRDSPETGCFEEPVSDTRSEPVNDSRLVGENRIRLHYLSGHEIHRTCPSATSYADGVPTNFHVCLHVCRHHQSRFTVNEFGRLRRNIIIYYVMRMTCGVRV